MKKTLILSSITLLSLTAVITPSCKSMAKAAAKHWTKKQKKMFVKKCKDGVVGQFGEKANDICSCVSEKVEKQFPKIEEAMEMSAFQLLKIAKDCR